MRRPRAELEPSNGFELWRQLVSDYAPRTRARGSALLSAFMGYSGFTKDRSFREQIKALERIADESNKSQARPLQVMCVLECWCMSYQQPQTACSVADDRDLHL